MRPLPSNINEDGSGTGGVEPPVVPPINVSGLVPNENVTLWIVVFAVTPDRASVNVAGPMTYGSKLPNPLFTFPYVPPFAIEGAII